MITLRKVDRVVVEFGEVLLHLTPSKITDGWITGTVTRAVGMLTGSDYPIMVGAEHTFPRDENMILFRD